MGTYSNQTGIRILTILQNSYGIKETENKASIEKINRDIEPGTVKTNIIDRQKQTGKILLTDAETMSRAAGE